MKKFLSIFLVLTILITCVACGKTEPVNNDSTTTTESTTENATESTTKDETTTESVAEEEESTTVVNESTTKMQKEEETKKNNTTTTTKPKETTTKKAETTTKKPPANTTTKPSASKPYFVSMDVISVSRPNSFTVNGTHILDKIYGKNTVFQNGDTITYKMNMSDGGTTGFKLSSKWNCSVTTNGNIITVKVNGSLWSDAIVEFTVDTKTGTQKVQKKVSIHGVTGDLGTTSSVQSLIREYLMMKGLVILNGTEDEPVLIYDVKIPGNNNWKSEVFTTIDKCINSGYKKCCYQLVPQDGFQITMHK